MNHLGGCTYFEKVNGDTDTWAPQVWDKLIEWYNPKSIIDVGCGAGHSLKYFIDRGINGIGIEGYEPAINASPVKENIIKHDYTESEFIPDKIYDLAWSCEFVEHVKENFLNNFMKTFEMCKMVAMTHAVPGQKGYHHVNCQNNKYWINKFNKFEYLENESLEIRNLLPSTNGLYVKNTLMIFKLI